MCYYINTGLYNKMKVCNTPSCCKHRTYTVIKINMWWIFLFFCVRANVNSNNKMVMVIWSVSSYQGLGIRLRFGMQFFSITTLQVPPSLPMWVLKFPQGTVESLDGNAWEKTTDCKNPCLHSVTYSRIESTDLAPQGNARSLPDKTHELTAHLGLVR